MKKIKILGPLVLIATHPAYAAIVGFDFNDTNSASKLIQTNTISSTYVNNVGKLGVYASAGLDRKLQISVVENGNETSTATSDVITAKDSYSPFGKEYFGSYLTVDVPADGQYTIVAKTLSLSGDVVDSTSTNIIRDTISPSMDNLSVKYMYGGYVNSLLPDNSWYLGAQMGSYASTLIQITNIEDLAGIESIEFQSFTLNDSLEPVFYKSVPMTFTASEKKAEVNLSSNGSIYPKSNADTLFKARAKVTDSSGNVSYTDYQDVYWDSVKTDTLEAVGVKVPNSTNVIGGLTGFEPYVQDMEVDTNPVTILYRVADWNYRDSSGQFNNPGGIMVSGADAIYTDRNDGYVYFTDTGPIGSKTISWRNQAHYRNTVGPSLYNVVPSDIAQITPVAKGGQYYYSDSQSWDSWSRRVYNHQLPVQVEKIRLYASTRNFDQISSHAGNSCTIPAGSTYCDVVLGSPWKMQAGSSQYYHDAYTVKNIEGTLVSNPVYPVSSYNDRYYPEITVTQYDDETKELYVRVYQNCQDCYQKRIGLKTYQLQDEDGNKLSISPSTVTQNSSVFEIYYDLTNLPEGTFDIYAYAEELHGPSANVFALKYTNDRTGPIIDFGYDGEELPSEVSDLRNVSFTLTDESTIKDIEVTLTGSRFDIDYQLGYSKSSENGGDTTYTLELPKLFPTLDDGETYNLKVRTVDDFLNSSEKDADISYIPDNSIVLDTSNYLPNNNQALYYQDDKPLGSIYTNSPLKLDNSMLATGIQQAELTNNEASSFPIKVLTSSGWLEVSPGETKEFGVDLVEGNPLNVEVFPVNGGQEGSVDFLFNINQLTSKYLQ